MTAKSDPLTGTSADQRTSPEPRDLRELLAALEGNLSSGSQQVREEAILRLLDLGTDARPVLPAIARAIGDTDELVVTKALAAFDRLCPAAAAQLPGLWSRLSSCDDGTRLAAVEELVKILPTIAPDPAPPGGDRAEVVKEDAVQESPEVPLPPDLQGRWIAWDENQEKVVAAADTYPELMERVRQMGLVDPVIERAPGLHPVVASRPFRLLEGESADILKDVRETIPDADQWLDTPNTRLRCKKPRDLIGTAQERQLRYLLRGIWSGITS